ncbi:MAG: S41 family peptidase [Bacteroidota bacterium]
MKNILFSLVMLGLLGSCSLEKLVMKSAHRPQLAVQQTTQFKKANKYQQDFLYAAALVEETFPYYERYFEGDFEQEKQDVFKRLEKVEESYEFDYATKEFLAKLNNNHTYLQSENKGTFPFFVGILDGKLVITNVSNQVDTSLIGQTISAINDVPADQLLAYGLALTHGETPFQDSANVFRAFRPLNFYKYYDILKDSEVLQIQTEESDQIFELSLMEKGERWQYLKRETNSVYQMTRRKNRGYSCKILEDKSLAYFQFNTFMDKPTMIDGIGLYLRKPYQGLVRSYVRYQYKRMEKGKKTNGYFQKGTQDFKGFLAKMFEEIKKRNVETLVIDLRYNGGGDLELGNYITSYLAGGENLKGYGEGLKISNSNKIIFGETYQLLDSLHQLKYGKPIPDGVFTEEELATNYTQKDFYKNQQDPNSIYYLERPDWQFRGKVYIISGANTASAASMFAVQMKDNGLAEIIGVPPANLPTGPTVVLPMALPNTKRRISISTNFLTRPDSSRHDAPYLEMDHYFPLTKEDYFENRDRAMEYVMEQIEQEKM